MYGIEFKNPEYLLLFIPLAGMAVWYIYGKLYDRGPALAVSSGTIINRYSSLRSRTYRYLPLLRFLILFLLVIAMARPGKGLHYTSIKQPGIDIMIALDVSDSMMGEDFKPKNRLGVAKQVVRDFIGRRETDRIGLVVFSGDAYLQCPLTVELPMVAEIVDEIDFETVDEEGTAIGEALALAASRMIHSRSKSRIILLITDGMNNRGSIDPETAARMCAELGIRIYAVGIGSEGRVPYPAKRDIFRFKHYMYNHFNEDGIRRLADLTGGNFYRATSSGVFWEKIRDIDRLEKSEITARKYHRFSDRFITLLLAAMGLFFFEIIIRSVYYRKVP